MLGPLQGKGGRRRAGDGCLEDGVQATSCGMARESGWRLREAGNAHQRQGLKTPPHHQACFSKSASWTSPISSTQNFNQKCRISDQTGLICFCILTNPWGDVNALATRCARAWFAAPHRKQSQSFQNPLLQETQLPT